jgi:hypothetical protein
MTFIADVGTYFQAVSQYLPNKVQDYCEACQQNYDYCYAMANGQQYYPEGYVPEDDAAAAEDGAEEEAAAEDGAEDEAAAEGEDQAAEGEDANADGGRKKARKLQNGQIVKFIDCAMCADYECLDFQQSANNGYYNDKGEFVQADLDEAMEWLNGFSECSETMAYLDEYLLYSGLMCNADGSGLEIGLFLDDDCLMYTPKVAFKDVMQDTDNTYYSMISDIVEFTFDNDGIDCYDPEIVWYNEVDYAWKQQNGEIQEAEQQEDNGEAPEAAEWCRQAVQNDVVNMYDCSGYYPDENANQNGDDYVNTYSWYSFELTQENADNVAAVCYALKELDGENHNTHTVFNNEHEGLFNYHKNKKTQSSGMSAGGIFGIVLLVFVAIGGAYGAMTYYKKKSSEDKKKPLINEEGQLA